MSFIQLLTIFSLELRLPENTRKDYRLSAEKPKQRTNVNQVDCLFLKCVLLWGEDGWNGIKHSRWCTPRWKKSPREYQTSITRVSRQYRASRCLQRDDNANNSSFKAERKFVECLSFSAALSDYCLNISINYLIALCLLLCLPSSTNI